MFYGSSPISANSFKFLTFCWSYSNRCINSIFNCSITIDKWFPYSQWSVNGSCEWIKRLVVVFLHYFYFLKECKMMGIKRCEIKKGIRKRRGGRVGGAVGWGGTSKNACLLFLFCFVLIIFVVSSFVFLILFFSLS